MENGIGSPGQAQPYVDSLMELAKQANGWEAVEGKYAPKRKAAKAYIKEKAPQFGIFRSGRSSGCAKRTALRCSA